MYHFCGYVSYVRFVLASVTFLQIVLAAAGATSTMAQATSTGLVLGLGFVDIMWTLLLQIVDVSGCSQQ